jgi:hypothetical protein
MKLRVRHNSIRFRLAQSDVHNLRISGRCGETILFPGGSRLEYVLLASRTRKVGAVFSEGVVSISVPEDQLTAWHSSSQVGISAAVEVYPGMELEVLVEKDFRCLDVSVLEDQSDMFENPLDAHVVC